MPNTFKIISAYIYIYIYIYICLSFSRLPERRGLGAYKPKDARGVEKTTGRVNINDSSSESSESESEGQVRKKTRPAKKRIHIVKEKPKTEGPPAKAEVLKAQEEASRGTAPQAYTSESPLPLQNYGTFAQSPIQEVEEEPAPKTETVAVKTVETTTVVQRAPDKEKVDNRRRGSDSSLSSAASSASSSSSSSRDYSDSEKEEDKVKEEQKDNDLSGAALSGIKEESEDVKKETETITKEIKMSEDDVQGRDDDKYGIPVGERADDEEEELKVRGYQGPVMTDVEPENDGQKVEESRHDAQGGDNEESEPPTLETVVEITAPEDEEDKEEKEEQKEENIIDSERTAPATVTQVTAETAQLEGVPQISPARRASDASSSSSSALSSSSSSGSAAISDRGPNLVNDPTAAPEHAKDDVEEAGKLENGSSVEKGNGEDGEEVKEDNPKEEEPPVVATVVAPPDAQTEQEKEEEKSEENEKKADSSSSDSSSDSDSADDSDSSDSNTKSNKSPPQTMNNDAVIETKAEVHLSEEGKTGKVTRFDQDSDPEATHGGHDPDNVANTAGGPVQSAAPPSAPAPTPLEGSIRPLLEKGVTTVELKGVMLNKTQVYEAAQFLERKDRINQLNMVNCGLDDDDVQKLMEALKESPSNPVLLNLNLNPLTSDCVTHILDILASKPSIEAVLLQGTRLGDEGIEKLVDGILSLHGKKRAEQGEGQAENLKEVRELDLSDCKFGDDGAVAISRLIRSDMDIDTLALSSNPTISAEGWRIIGSALARNSNLETLTLDHNFIGDEGVEDICQGLYNNKSLTALDLNYVGITDKGGKCLMELLKRNTVLLEITHVGNQIPTHQADDIKKYMNLNKTIENK